MSEEPIRIRGTLKIQHSVNMCDCIILIIVLMCALILIYGTLII